MLQEIYINNYKCLVNFTFSLKNINLILGGNGSGKSTLFEVLSKIKQFISDGKQLSKTFSQETLTRWQNITVQNFELTAKIQDKKYSYKLSIEHNRQKNLCRVQSEQLFVDNNPIFDFNLGTIKLFRDDFSAGPEYPFDWSQAGLATIHPRPDNQLLSNFKLYIDNLLVIKPNPMMMSNESQSEERQLSCSCDNFSSWYRFLSQEHQAGVFELTAKLREIMPGFHSFRLAQSGEDSRLLQIGFTTENSDVIFYRLNELSDGQRMMILLYSILYVLNRKNICICMDEPENFLALPEIQPWLVTFYDLCQDHGMQVLLISHNPEIINYLASGSGYWFERLPNSPTRIRPIVETENTGIKLSELIARGWIYE